MAPKAARLKKNICVNSRNLWQNQAARLKIPRYSTAVRTFVAMQRKLLRLLLAATVALALFTLWANRTITSQSAPYITSDINGLTPRKVGVLLGTNKYFRTGQKNLYFLRRIDAAVALFQQGKIQYIIVSGDNSRKEYSEPDDMRQELLARGIPADKIYADFAGFRTLDSVLRARDIFGLSTFILISQKFHNERAVYIARSNGIEAVGYNAADVNPASPLKTTLREIFARDKVFFDRWLGVGPKFGGETVEIP